MELRAEQSILPEHLFPEAGHVHGVFYKPSSLLTLWGSHVDPHFLRSLVCTLGAVALGKRKLDIRDRVFFARASYSLCQAAA